MCRHITILAMIDDHYYVAHCEHNTLHLGWDYACYHLRLDDFWRITRFLERSAAGNFDQIEVEECCALIRQKNGYYQLWLGDTALFLSETGFCKLIALVQLAIQTLSDKASNPQLNLPKAQTYRETAQLKPGILFSTN
jgi:hypothetical protein